MNIFNNKRPVTSSQNVTSSLERRCTNDATNFASFERRFRGVDSLERRYNVDTQKFIAQNDAGNVGCGSNIHVSLGG